MPSAGDRQANKVWDDGLGAWRKYGDIQALDGEDLNLVTTGGGALQHNGAPIVESGSNSDGEWTRWADGTQVCRVTDYDGGHSEVKTWVFPKEFIDDEYSVSSTVTWVEQVNRAVIRRSDQSTDNTQLQYSIAQPDETTSNVHVDFVVVGWWK